MIHYGWRELQVTGGAQCAIETLSLLAGSFRIPTASTTRSTADFGSVQEFSNFGEVDFVVVNCFCSKGLRG